MLIKEQDDRINFIDKNDNFVGIENPSIHHGLCEFAWWFTDDENEVGTMKPRENPQMLKDGSLIDLSNLLFDVKSDFFRGELIMSGIMNKNPVMGDTETMDNRQYVLAAKLKDDIGCTYWLVMVNKHNSWYSLGWESNLVPRAFTTDNGI